VPACPVCGAERPAGARFCPSCGAALAEEAPAPAGQERRLVTILFADVTGSTGLGERLDLEPLQELLATHFHRQEYGDRRRRGDRVPTRHVLPASDLGVVATGRLGQQGSI
jgi:class 3 adenylate cyclase